VVLEAIGREEHRLAGVLGFVRRDSGSGVVTKDALWVCFYAQTLIRHRSESRQRRAFSTFSLNQNSGAVRLGHWARPKRQRMGRPDGGWVGFLLVGP
jgi:hypothetical protein